MYLIGNAHYHDACMCVQNKLQHDTICGTTNNYARTTACTRGLSIVLHYIHRCYFLSIHNTRFDNNTIKTIQCIGNYCNAM